MPNAIKIPFDPARTLREQIEAAIVSVSPRRCDRHPREVLPVDTTATIRRALHHPSPYEEQPRYSDFACAYERCSQCPHNQTDRDIEVDRCAVGVVPFLRRDFCIRDEQGRPLPRRFKSAALEAGRSAQSQFDSWLADEFRCPLSGEALRRRKTHLKSPFEFIIIEPQFVSCPQCGLERLGISLDEAHASFENFLVDPPALQQHLDQCRAFAASPAGVLLMVGNTGAAKTHLAIAILRELLRRSTTGLRFVKHRHFLAAHRLALRPVPFGREPEQSPLADCQEATLLVYDELTETAEAHAHEDVLLDLFEVRIGNFRPSIITANVARADLEIVLGTRLYDRLRRATFAVLEFGFESKRSSLKADYFNRYHGRGI